MKHEGGSTKGATLTGVPSTKYQPPKVLSTKYQLSSTEQLIPIIEQCLEGVETEQWVRDIIPNRSNTTQEFVEKSRNPLMQQLTEIPVNPSAVDVIDNGTPLALNVFNTGTPKSVSIPDLF